MFDFDAGKLLIVGVIALIFIPPKDLPRVLRQVGQFVGRMRRMAAEFQGQFMDAMRDADMADLRKEAQKLADAARVDTRFPVVQDLNKDVTGAIEARSTTSEPQKFGVQGSGPNAAAPPVEEPNAFEALRTELRPLVGEDKPKSVPAEPGTDNVPHSAG